MVYLDLSTLPLHDIFSRNLLSRSDAYMTPESPDRFTPEREQFVHSWWVRQSVGWGSRWDGSECSTVFMLCSQHRARSRCRIPRTKSRFHELLPTHLTKVYIIHEALASCQVVWPVHEWNHQSHAALHLQQGLGCPTVGNMHRTVVEALGQVHPHRRQGARPGQSQPPLKLLARSTPTVIDNLNLVNLRRRQGSRPSQSPPSHDCLLRVLSFLKALTSSDGK